MAAFEDSDFEKMEEIRARVDAIVEDAETAQRLKAWYRQLCKRPCFHDEYLQAFNQPGTHLVDTDGRASSASPRRAWSSPASSTRSTASSTPPASRSAPSTRAGPATTWSGATVGGCRSTGSRACARSTASTCTASRTCSSSSRRQGANLISNVPHNLTESGTHDRHHRASCPRRRRRRVEVTKPAEDAWIELLLTGPGSLIGSPDCTPGYYNNEGQDRGPAAKLFVGYPTVHRRSSSTSTAGADPASSTV